MTKAKFHLFNNFTIVDEIDAMFDFINSYEKLYICGCGEYSEYLLKFFDMCDVKIDGYCVTNPDCEQLTYNRQIPIISIEDVAKIQSVGVLMGLKDTHYHTILPKFREHGFSDYFVLSEYNKAGIAERMKPRTKDLMTFEINLVDHCNLSCQMCDHYSQVSDEWFVDMASFENDIKRMAQIYNHEIACITLVGGEPTLHPQLLDCMRITRREFPNGELIILTNGILLPQLENSSSGNFWEVAKSLDFHITVTVYPIGFDYGKLEQLSEKYGVPCSMTSNIHAKEITKIVKVSDKHVMDLNCGVPKRYCIGCLYLNKFNVVKDGRYFACPVQAHIDIFNKAFGQNLPFVDGDYLDIYKVHDWREFSEFGANRVPFCSHCDIKNWKPDSQWKPSSKLLSEYV